MGAQHTRPLCLQVQAALSAYAARFKQMKAPRQLVWRHTAGLVKLAITLDDRRLELSVSPLHATILLHFKVCPSGVCVKAVHDFTTLEQDCRQS